MAQSTDPFFLDDHIDMSNPPDSNNSNGISQSSEQVATESVSQDKSSRPASVSPTAPTSAATVETAMSIQAILSATKHEGLNGSAPQSWSPALPSTQTNQVSSSNKRKLEDSEAEDSHTKIRRIVRDHLLPDPSRVVSIPMMTTVICLHAAVAQKSYGSEKRFLCPPPVVHVEGPLTQMRTQQLSMAVVSESGERSFVQKSSLDNNMAASFKFLHVTGTAKAKSFQLSLDIADASLNPDGADSPPGRVWASFDSAPVTIISKPSKKTAKTRNITSCILAGGPVSLFNRINSQTVRTKYMTIDHAQLCASNVSWSAFNVNVVRKPGTPPTPVASGQPVTYGCEIVLSDAHSGITTAPLIIRKVDKGKVSLEDGGPVSQMQKIALQRVNPDGSRHYLSAAGPLPGTPGVIAPPTPGMSTQAGTHPLLFQSPRVREEVKDGFRVVCDEVDDYLCWTIVGISQFQYAFFDAFGQNGSIPDLPITPFPTLFTTPIYRPGSNHVELTVSNFFYEHPTTKQQTPLDVYLGNMGPLNLRVYQATPPGPLTNVQPYVAPGGQLITPGTDRYMQTPLHTIVIVDMPPIQDVIKNLEDQFPTPGNPTGPKISPEEGASSDGTQPHPSLALSGRGLPLLFIRASDGIGYHSGRTLACENVFHNLGPIAATSNANGENWIAAAVAEGLHGWTLRVL